MTAIAESGATATIVAPDEVLNRPEPAADKPEPGSPGRSWWPVAGCLAAYAVLAIIAFLPVGPFDTRRLPIAVHGSPAGNDPFQMTWFLSYVPYALTHGLSIFHTNYVEYPSGINLANNTSVPLLGILGWPITATLGPVASFNFLIRLSFALSGASMFLVLRRWCRSWQAPFVGGLIYAFGPYMASQELHLDLIFVPIPPLLFLCGDELVRRQRMFFPLLGLLIGLASAAQFLTSPDILSGCVLMALIVGAGLAVRFRDLIRSRIAYILKAGVVAAGCFVVVAAYPVYEMLRGPGHISGPVVEVSLLQSARADLLGVIVPTSNQLLAPHFLSWIGDYFVGENLSENGTYLGIPLLILLIVILRKLKKDATVMVMAYTALAAWVLSLGGHLVIGTWNSPIPLPGDLLAHSPLFDNTIPARYALYVILPVAFVVAVGLDRIWLSSFRSPGSAGYRDLKEEPWSGRLRALARSRRARLFLLAGVIAVTLLPDAPFASATVPWPAALPATVTSVVPPGTVVLPVPFATPSSAEAMAWAAVDDMRFRIIGGYANIADPGEPHGQRQPPPLPPAHVQEMFSTPKLGSMLPYVPPTVADVQLITYLDRYSVGAVVFVSMGPDTSIGYWYLIDTLGQPEVVRPGFAIWMPKDGRWPSRPVG
jgi:hypothetical protein